MNQDQIKQFESLAKPLMEWLKENSCSKTVVLTSDSCHLLNADFTIERRTVYNEESDEYENVLLSDHIEEEIIPKPVTIRNCENCSLRDWCEKHSECNEQNGFPLFEDFPF